MWKLSTAVGAAALLALGLATAPFAQTTPPATNPPATTKAAPKATTTAKPRSAESIECSKQANAKGLHGKERKTFRSKCMKDMKKKT